MSIPSFFNMVARGKKGAPAPASATAPELTHEVRGAPPASAAPASTPALAQTQEMRDGIARRREQALARRAACVAAEQQPKDLPNVDALVRVCLCV